MVEDPNVLHKYLPLGGAHADIAAERLARVVDLLTNHRFWWASPSSFNDPFDCSPPWDGPTKKGSRTAMRAVLRERGFQNRKARRAAERQYHFRPVDAERIAVTMGEKIANSAVCSLTPHGKQPLMWAHYANSHEGVCLAFTTAMLDRRRLNPFMLAQPVIYSENRPSAGTEMGKRAPEILLLTKSLDWSYEEEWRCVEWDAGFGLREFPADALLGIAFGCRTSAADKAVILEVVRQRRSPISVYQATPDPRVYEMNYDRVQLD